MDKWLTPDYRQHMDPHRPEQWVKHFGFRAAASLMLDHYHYFTHEDVEGCRRVAANYEIEHERTDDVSHYEAWMWWKDLADRIEALLPPRDDEPST